MQHWMRLYFQLPLFIRLFSTVIVFMIFFGIIIHTIEPNNFPTLFDGIWWAFVTGATVGYGDYVPLSTAGKITAIFLILTGGGLVTFYMATLSAATVQHERNLSRGKVDFKGKEHIILIGWNERTRQLIEMMTENKCHEYIVLIDRTMKQLYENHSNVHFIHGDATMEETLDKANVKEAKTAIVTADPSKAEHAADQSVIHQVVSLKGHNSQLFIIAEVLTDKQKINAERAGADRVVRSNDFMSSLFYHELFHTDPGEPFQLLLDLLTSRQFHEETVPTELQDQLVEDAVTFYLEKGSVVIGYRYNQTPHFILEPSLPLADIHTLILLIPLRT
ncbi:putative potassium channel protein YugO [Halobacillus andaensis]|uniref:Potassium channel protein YugO n=1 Tax=Halobacillus andaensis TaxID=1176239 RepID=A0A917F1A3_HALAA|nr:potassium channel family protein [Halobacillus andaensis]MBP2005609.1 voltage-gated potassium channel [Halobacillus andaensis]GGF32816.1 putative potassium channel protein YugO [Halobacillus andaensis]